MLSRYMTTETSIIGENVVHEPLETCQGIGEPLGHHKPLERPISGPQGGFPFVAIGNMDEVVGLSQVNLGVDSCLAQSI